MKEYLVNISLLAGVFIFILAVEVILRLATPSLDNPLVRLKEYDGIEWYQINRSYLQKYFPGKNALAPEFKTALFKREKPENLFRVFCLGGSTMFGTPYLISGNIPGIVRRQLRHLYPEREFEVINLAASAINSRVVRDLAGQVTAFQPDLILIYMGHNEFYGPGGVGASALEKRFSFLASLKYGLRELRIYQVLQKLLTKKSAAGLKPGDRNLMKQVSQGNEVRLRSEEAQRVFEQFQKNLEKTVAIFQKKNIPVVVSDVVSNLSFPPFLYDRTAGKTDVETLADRVQDLYRQHHYSEAGELLDQYAQIAPDNALINYWEGKIRLALRQPGQAYRFFISARDHDLLKFRAPLKINQIIRAVCRRRQIPFISADSLFANLSPNGITDTTLFWEHLHPNIRGYYEIADLFVRKVEELHIPGTESAGAFSGTLLPFQLDSLAVCWLDIAYADLSMRNLTGKWPFSNYPVTLRAINAAETGLRRIAKAVYTKQMSWDQGCYKSAVLFQRRKRYRQAITTYRALIEEYPYYYYPWYLLANVSKESGHNSAAERFYRKSISLKGDYLHSRLELGLLEINSAEFDRAIADLQAALHLVTQKNKPSLRATVSYGLAAAYANKNDFQRALDYINQSLAAAPSYLPAIELRKQILQVQKGN